MSPDPSQWSRLGWCQAGLEAQWLECQQREHQGQQSMWGKKESESWPGWTPGRVDVTERQAGTWEGVPWGQEVEPAREAPAGWPLGASN